uniref:G-patch domain-containing protein n=1 Tax=Graphocephala atropunctata TaxID=36148 RepID=A0A1B6KCU9_9HEMI
MQLVAELSKGVADEHREKQKGKLKRTFVQASDAANAKIKRSQSEPPNKMNKTGQEGFRKGFEYSQFVQAGLVEPSSLDPKPQNIISEFSGFVIFEYGNTSYQETCPTKILFQSSQKKGQQRNIKFNLPIEKNTMDKKYCEISIDKEFLSSGHGSTIKEAKEMAAKEGLNKLRKTCYTIQVKQAFFSDNPSLTKDGSRQETDSPISQDNIGSRMMQKMGWTGSGLGKQKQGIQTPVQAASQIMHRAGIGCTNHKQLQGRFRQVFKDYIASNSDHDLVFTSDFSSDERKTLHQLAHSLHLRTKSFGKGSDRHLVVSKILAPVDLVEMLLACGGENEKYLLIPPTGTDNT